MTNHCQLVGLPAIRGRGDGDFKRRLGSTDLPRKVFHFSFGNLFSDLLGDDGTSTLIITEFSKLVASAS